MKKEIKQTEDKPGFFERLFLRLFIKQLIKKLETMKGSWITKLLGLATLLIAIGAAIKAVFDGDPNTSVDINEIMAALAGLGLFHARQNNVTSEQAGAK